MAKAKQPTVPSAPLPEPNKRDKAAMDFAKARVLARRKRASIAIDGTGSDLRASSPHADASGHHTHLLDTFGTASSDFMNATLTQFLNAVADRGTSAPGEVAINAALAVMGGVEPQNEVEALLASQMAATHSLAMSMLGRARRCDLLNQTEAHGSLAVKLLRTFSLQAETLAKLRRGGGQTMRVEHVHVYAGGQAVVGNVAPGGGTPKEIEDQPHAKQTAALSHADAPIDPLRSTNAMRDPVPVARHA